MKKVKSHIKTTGQILKIIFRQWQYLVLSLGVALFFYAFNALIANYKLLSTSEVIFPLIFGFHHTVSCYSLTFFILISVLLGILVSIIVFKLRISKKGHKRIGALGMISAFLGAFAPGCAACGIGLASLLGVSSATIAVLPFGGLEVAILATILLIYSIIKISHDMVECKDCKIPKKLGGK